MTPDRSRIGRLNKSRAKLYESEAARILGGVRHKADTGGGEDVEHPEYVVQVKSGKTVATQVMRDGLASARAAAAGTTKLPALVLFDRRGGRIQRWICFPLEDFAAYHGYGGEG